jgi:AP-1-like factor
MDYSYFPAASQPYQFLGMPQQPFAVDQDTIHSVVSVTQGEVCRAEGRPRTQRNSLTNQPSSQQEPMDASFLPTTYDAFPFHQGLPTTQASPDPGAALTPTIGSLDSGLGVDMEDSRMSRTRSSSEEKEGLTPAQSRRKAQNRAAYVI